MECGRVGFAPLGHDEAADGDAGVGDGGPIPTEAPPTVSNIVAMGYAIPFAAWNGQSFSIVATDAATTTYSTYGTTGALIWSLPIRRSRRRVS